MSKLTATLGCIALFVLVVSGCTNTGQVTTDNPVKGNEKGAYFSGDLSSLIAGCDSSCKEQICNCTQTINAKSGINAPDMCTGANLVIKKAIHDADNGKISIMLYNPGTVSLDGFDVSVTYEGDDAPSDEWKINAALGKNAFDTFTGDARNKKIELVEVRSSEYEGAYDAIRGSEISS